MACEVYALQGGLNNFAESKNETRAKSATDMEVFRN